MPEDAFVDLWECGRLCPRGPVCGARRVRGPHVLWHASPEVWGERAARTPGARRSIFAEGSL